MQIKYTVASPQGTQAIAGGEMPDDADAFFVQLRDKVLAWHAPLAPGSHSFSVFLKAHRRDDAQRTFLQAVCARWNDDAGLRALPPLHVEVSIGTDREQWLGCTTAGAPMDRRSPVVPMHVFDWAQLLAAIEQAQRDAKQAERARRREHPVVRAVPLPRDIASRIAKYLRLEYGESRWQRGSLKARDLQFAGEFVVDGVPTQYWRYPTSAPNDPGWATVERFEDHYRLGMGGNGPPDGI